ncbi:hypothetical protein ACH5RR_015344 [Cinchona calisaya]|uniref:DDE Tnp4 domain-containing protein n=1 Tax=Cinchona calisaya TaxID=153742 RepID=A0ABD2ZWD6_9GENT
MKHAKARNVIERCFGLLKGRWKILASPALFPIQTQGRIILACSLLQNLIRRKMSTDPQEMIRNEDEQSEDEEDGKIEYISIIGSTDEWTNFRNNLAQGMYSIWRRSRA